MNTNLPAIVVPLLNYDKESPSLIMELLCAVGMPRLSKMKDGWNCSCEMHVSAAGTTFTIRSEFDCQTQTDATRQCAERVVATFKQWHK